mmetsp:Transcript_12010/g.16798  ORF Transcript_12010/g.16798 Transcript_12010/m.16798 type:complete len:177 (-) Transcript_12010:1092-1622(-)
MMSLRFMKLFVFALVLLLAVSHGAAEEGQDCAAAGDCINPDAGVEETGEEEPVDAEEETVEEVAVSDSEEEEKIPEDPGCPSRPHIIRCAAAHLDINKNNKLDRKELQDAIDSLPWLARGVLKILGSVDSIMSKCDADGDDAIGIDTDMESTKETCLASCFKRKAFKQAFFPDCDL